MQQSIRGKSETSPGSAAGTQVDSAQTSTAQADANRDAALDRAADAREAIRNN